MNVKINSERTVLAGAWSLFSTFRSTTFSVPRRRRRATNNTVASILKQPVSI
jgi:hypothetical protein